MKHSACKHVFFACLLASVFCASASAQITDTSGAKKVVRKETGLVKKLTLMPYVTGSFNLQSGEAFPKAAQGLGFGFGVAVDLTEDRQPLGAYIDFAYQDMRASAANGACAPTNYTDNVYQTLNATHYFSYVLLETFLKIQSQKTNGYFLLGGSFGLATTELTARDGAIPEYKYSDWSGAVNPATNSTYGHKFRFDLRAGIGIKLGYVSGHELVFEARFGYPVTSAVSDYHDVCNGTVGTDGSWRVVTLQGNIGLRL